MKISNLMMIRFLAFWMLLQIPRLIAVPLIADILNGIDSPAWMYPAVLDVFVAIASPFMAYAMIKKRGLMVWMSALIYLVISIIDHGDAVTAALLTGTPRVFSNMGSGPSTYMIPSIQAGLDFLFLIWMMQHHVRDELINYTK